MLRDNQIKMTKIWYLYSLWSDNCPMFEIKYALLDGHSVLQELLLYNKYETYTEAESFMDRIINKIEASNDELFLKVS